MNENREQDLFDVVIVGGLGHVGLPLGISFAHLGLSVCLFDRDEKRAQHVRDGMMPFIEYDAEPILRRVLQEKRLTVSTDMSVIGRAHYVVIAIGTPIDEYLTPKTHEFLESVRAFKPYLRIDQTIIVRSTVYPRTSRQLLKMLGEDKPWRIAYCPERTIEGYAVRELSTLPQIVSGLSEEALDDAANLFGKLSPKVIRTLVGEAELVKLFSNAWRYIQFATTNQFFMMAHNFGVNYDNVRKAMTDGYGRVATMPSAGFAAGPCLLKDTMQLACFTGNEFALGHAAMLVNEGLPNFLVQSLSKRFNLEGKHVGILGMVFKAEIDDPRDSLSFKLKKILKFHGATVVCSDEYMKDLNFVSKEELLKRSDIVIVGVPHSAYRDLSFPENVYVVDLWGITKSHKAFVKAGQTS